jgi:hypothetical protein
MKYVSTKANGYLTRNGAVYSTENVAKRPLDSVYCTAALKGAVAEAREWKEIFDESKSAWT